MSSFNFGSVLKALNTAGVSPTSIPSVMQAIAQLHAPSSTVTALLNQLMINVNNPDAIKTIVTQIESTPGVPSTVLPLLESLKAPNVTPLQISQSVTQIEAAVSASTSLL